MILNGVEEDQNRKRKRAKKATQAKGKKGEFFCRFVNEGLRVHSCVSKSRSISIFSSPFLNIIPKFIW